MTVAVGSGGRNVRGIHGQRPGLGQRGQGGRNRHSGRWRGGSSRGERRGSLAVQRGQQRLAVFPDFGFGVLGQQDDQVFDRAFGRADVLVGFGQVVVSFSRVFHVGIEGQHTLEPVQGGEVRGLPIVV